jgi:hypothetical protein
MHGRLELVITHIGRFFFLSLSQKKEPATTGHAWKASACNYPYWEALSLSLSLSLFSKKEPAAMVHVHGFMVLKKSKLVGYNKIKESSNTGSNLHLH